MTDDEKRRAFVPDISSEDWQKFWMETARILVLALLGTGATYLIVQPLKHRDDYEALVEGQRLTIRSKVVDDFMQSASNYTAATYDVLRGKGNVAAWQSHLIDNYRAKIDLMRVHFGTKVDNGLDEAKADTDALWEAFKAFEAAKEKGEAPPAISWGKTFDHLELVHRQVARDALVELRLVKGE